VREIDGAALRPSRGVFFLDLLRGFASLFQGGLMLFTRPEYAGQLRVPVIANLLVLAAVLLGVFFGAWELFDWLLSGSWGFLEFLHGIAGWASATLAMILAAITMFLVTPVLIETVTGPFLDPLAATTERLHGGASMRALDPGVWRGIWSGLRSSAQILAIQLLVLVPALLLSLTGIGALLVTILSAWLQAIVWFDIPCARRGLDLRARIALLRHNWAKALGFGLAVQLGLFIPLFNVLLLAPAAAVAVSSLFFRFAKPAPTATLRDPAAPVAGA
jgi:CysZ protein